MPRHHRRAQAPDLRTVARRRIKDARGRAQGGEGGQRPFRGGRSGPKSKYQVVRAMNNLGYSERFACQVVGLDRSSYYDIKFRKPNDRGSIVCCSPMPSRTSTHALGAPMASCASGRLGDRAGAHCQHQTGRLVARR